MLALDAASLVWLAVTYLGAASHLVMLGCIDPV